MVPAIAGRYELRPADFPIGSPESRAVARVEGERRERAMFENAYVVITTGLPVSREFRHPPTVAPPDITYHQVPDGSIVEAIYRYWEGENEAGLTVGINQVWPNGEVYNGHLKVQSLAELHGVPHAGQAVVGKSWSTNANT